MTTPPINGQRTCASSKAARPGGFVREATAADLEALGRVHASTMLASLRAAHAAAHEGADLPAGVTAMITAPVIAAGWEAAVVRPPAPDHHVLVATSDDEVVGLIAIAPAPLADPGAGAEPDSGTAPGGATGGEDRRTGDGGGTRPPAAVELVALGVEASRQRRGHGSRLLAAAVEYARQDGAGTLLVWAVRGDESMARFLKTAGLRPTGSHRQLPVGMGITEECWAAAL